MIVKVMQAYRSILNLKMMDILEISNLNPSNDPCIICFQSKEESWDDVAQNKSISAHIGGL